MYATFRYDRNIKMYNDLVNKKNDQQMKYEYNVGISHMYLNTLRSVPNGQHFADNVSKSIFFLIPISLKFVPKGPINNKSSLV